MKKIKKDYGYIRDSVVKFMFDMEDQLRANEHKGGWKHLDDSYLLARLMEELGELAVAIEYGTNKKEIIREAADVANFAMMIADKCSQGENK